MDTRKRNFLAALLLLNNGLLMAVSPAAACGGGVCPPRRVCLVEGGHDRCAFLNTPDMVFLCNFMSGDEKCHAFRVSCVDSPIDTEEECLPTESVVFCEYVSCEIDCS
jgi:hypothetical protein